MGSGSQSSATGRPGKRAPFGQVGGTPLNRPAIEEPRVASIRIPQFENISPAVISAKPVHRPVPPHFDRAPSGHRWWTD